MLMLEVGLASQRSVSICMCSECFTEITLLCRSVYTRSSVAQPISVCLGQLCICCTACATKFRGLVSDQLCHTKGVTTHISKHKSFAS